jgi:hypothetical protein
MAKMRKGKGQKGGRRVAEKSRRREDKRRNERERER